MFSYLFNLIYFSEENLELMEDLNAIELIVDAIKMHKKVIKFCLKQSTFT